MARNIEVLRNYFLGKDPQLKEILADNSLRLCGIAGRHYVLRSELIARLGELKTHVDEQDTELQEAIDEVIQDLGSEATLRANADLALQNNINSEGNTRQTADNQLSGRITTNANDILALNTWKNTTDFVLDSDLIEALGNYYTKPEINQMISVLPRFSIEVVQALPTQDISESTIYLVPSSNPELRNSYDEFIYVSNNWEQIGTTAIDLSNYYTKSQTDTLLNAKQNNLTPGANINIANDTISTDGYTVKTLTNYDTNVWALNTGVYYIATDGYLHINPDDSNVKVQLNKNGLLIVEKASNTEWKYTLYMGDGLIYGIADTVGGTTTFTSVSLTNFVGASGSNGRAGLVPAPTSSDVDKYLKSDGTWSTVSTGQTYSAGDNISISNLNAISTVGDTIKNITGNTNLWQLDTGVYKLYDSGMLYLDPNDSQEYVPLSNKMYLLMVNKLTTNAVRYYLIGEKIAVYGISSSSRSYETSTNYIDLRNFIGTSGTSNGYSGFVPAPTTADAGKFLSADGTWQNAGGGSTITYGDTDLTPGVSPLADGEFYFVYE